MLIRFALVALLPLAILSELSEFPFRRGEVWSGEFTWEHKDYHLDLVVHEVQYPNARVVWHDYTNGVKTAWSLQGNFHMDTGKVNFHPVKWLTARPAAWELVGMNGTVTSDGRNFTGEVVAYPDKGKPLPAGQFVLHLQGCGHEDCSEFQFALSSTSDLPPDRRMLGRSTWTFLHTTAAHLPGKLSVEERDAFVYLMHDINRTYACSLCRHHFHRIFRDAVLQGELYAVATRDDAQLWLWKVHNCVTARNFPSWRMFPESAHWRASLFHVASPPSSQLHLKTLTPAARKAVLDALNKRWRLPPSFPAAKSANAACPATSYPTVTVNFFSMSRSPFARNALEVIKHSIKCDLTCTNKERVLQGSLDFRLHFVGLNGTKGKLVAKDEKEYEGNEMVVCARKHYPMHYRWVQFMECLEEHESQIPANAKECAARLDLDYSLLQQCVTTEGPALVQKDFEYSAQQHVTHTPTINIVSSVVGHEVEYPVNRPTDIVEVRETLCRALAAASGLPTDNTDLTSHAALFKTGHEIHTEGHPAHVKAARKNMKAALRRDAHTSLLEIAATDSFSDELTSSFWWGAISGCVCMLSASALLVFFRDRF